MGFKTVVFDGYLTLTHLSIDGAIDFSNYTIEGDKGPDNGFQVQRFIAKNTAINQLVRFDKKSNEISIEDWSQQAQDKINSAKENHPYLKELNEKARTRKPPTLTEPVLEYSTNFGPSINFSCFSKQTSYRQGKTLREIGDLICSEDCTICGEKEDSFDQFYIMVEQSWKTSIWEGPIWECIGARLDILRFPATALAHQTLNLRNYFLEPGARVIDIHIAGQGPNDHTIDPEQFMQIGCYCLISEGTKKSLNLGSDEIMVYCLPFAETTNVESKQSLWVRWLPEDRVESDFSFYLALRAFSEHRYEEACTFAWTAFEKTNLKLKKIAVEIVGKELGTKQDKKEAWDTKWEEQKTGGNRKPHWKFILDIVLEEKKSMSSDLISPVATDLLKSLNNERQVVHRGKPTEETREGVFKKICAAILLSRLSEHLLEV